MIPDICTLTEAAEYLRKPERFVLGLAKTHKLAFLKQGRQYTFNREALEAYRLGNEVPAVQPNAFGLTDRSAARIKSSG